MFNKHYAAWFEKHICIICKCKKEIYMYIYIKKKTKIFLILTVEILHNST